VKRRMTRWLVYCLDPSVMKLLDAGQRDLPLLVQLARGRRAS
jgi:hypothetical protein